MGVLPALDGLQVVHRLLGEHGLNRRRTFLLGTSYGGYIAGMMAKFAPATFRMVVDNSGFSSAQDDIANVFGCPGIHVGPVALCVPLRCRELCAELLAPRRRKR